MIFNAVADALEWCGSSDCLSLPWQFAALGAPESEQCSHDLDLLKAVCSDLEIPLAPEKQAGSAEKLEHLQKLSVDLSIKICKQLQAKRRPSCTKGELDSLLGVMHYACTVIPAGKAFVRQIITLVNIVHKVQQTFPLWPIMVKHICQTLALISGSHDKEVIVTLDASGSWGCGAGYGSMWFQLQWNGKSQHL